MAGYQNRGIVTLSTEADKKGKYFKREVKNGEFFAVDHSHKRAVLAHRRLVKVMHLGTGEERHFEEIHTSAVTAVRLLEREDTPLAASVGYDGQLCVWDANSMSLVTAFYDHEGVRSWSVDIRPDGQAVSSGDNNGRVTIRSWKNGSKGFTELGTTLTTLQTRGGSSVMVCQFDPIEPHRILYTGGYDRKIQVWDYASGVELCELDFDVGIVFALEVTENHIFAAGRGAVIKIWDRHTKKLLRTIEGIMETTDIKSLCVLPDGSLAVGASSGQVNHIKWTVPSQSTGSNGTSDASGTSSTRDSDSCIVM